MKGKWLKRLILSVLTIVAIVTIVQSLGESFSKPQFQTRLELYQTDLILHAAEYKLEDSDDVSSSLQAAIGDNPYYSAEEQYQNALQAAQINLTNLQTQLQQLPLSSNIVEQQAQLEREIQQEENFIDELNLKIGILEVEQGNIETAQTTWNQLIESNQQPTTQTVISQTARVLQDLWSESPTLSEDSRYSIVANNLEGWFRYYALKQLNGLQANESELLTLEATEQEIASQAIFKLALIAGVPYLSGALGVILLIFLLIQLLLQKERSILAINNNFSWETPWDGETVWQVIIIGFFSVSQIVIPILIGISGVNPSGFSLRFKALYVLVTYLLMAAGGLLVLYFSIKPFFPLPKDWFKFQWLSNWIFWGLGGYLVAVPLVVLVSIINQQFWQGQGGSNPLLFLAVQAQDKVALAIFFVTASIAAPVFEEIIFRGFLLSSLTRYIPVWSAILASSLLFAIAHLSLSEVAPLTTLGIILGFVYTRSRNLLSSMLLHSLWNGGTLFSLFILGSGAG
ncbi:MAG: CPBP family intramembrane metalloprotease [Prochloraceae cyanobacterium]|nr:CPBP family intramembrane metalloprotease [Prochloraceae cyanobacterium]